jgi:hypothetical protein
MKSVDVRAMASVLAKRVPEIKDHTACRAALTCAGYTDEQISELLPGVQHLAREYRAETAERLMRKVNEK